MQEHLETRRGRLPEPPGRVHERGVRWIVDQVVHVPDLRKSGCGDRESVRKARGTERRRVHEELPWSAAGKRIEWNRVDGLVERLRQDFRSTDRPIRDLDFRSLPDQDADAGLRSSTRSDDENSTIPHAEPEGTEGESEPEDVRVVTLRPSVPDHDRVHRAETLRVAVEFVEFLDDRFFVWTRYVESADMMTVRGLQQGFQRIFVAVERQVDSGNVERAQRCFMDRGGEGMTERMADHAQDHRLTAAKARGSREGKLTGRGRPSPGGVLDLLPHIFGEGPRNHAVNSGADENDTLLLLRLCPGQVDELHRGIEVLHGGGHLRHIADRRAGLQRILDLRRIGDAGEMMRYDNRGTMSLSEPPEILDSFCVGLVFDVHVRETLCHDFVQEGRTTVASRDVSAAFGFRSKRGDRLRTDRRGEIPNRHRIEVPDEVEPEFREIGPFRKS